MNMNPQQLQMFRNIMKNGNNPKKMAMEMLNQTNPMAKNLIDLANKGNIENFARNICKSKGIDFDKDFAEFMKQIKG